MDVDSYIGDWRLISSRIFAGYFEILSECEGKNCNFAVMWTNTHRILQVHCNSICETSVSLPTRRRLWRGTQTVKHTKTRDMIEGIVTVITVSYVRPCTLVLARYSRNLSPNASQLIKQYEYKKFTFFCGSVRIFTNLSSPDPRMLWLFQFFVSCSDDFIGLQLVIYGGSHGCIFSPR